MGEYLYRTKVFRDDGAHCVVNIFQMMQGEESSLYGTCNFSVNLRQKYSQQNKEIGEFTPDEVNFYRSLTYVFKSKEKEEKLFHLFF